MDSRVVQAKVVVDESEVQYDGTDREAFEQSGASAIFTAPFLRLGGQRGRRRLEIGKTDVCVADGEAEVTVVVQIVRDESGNWSDGKLDMAGQQRLDGLPLPAELPQDPVERAACVAKAVAEAARNEMVRLRGLRYEFEREIAALLAKKAGVSMRPLLAQIIELSAALGRAREQAQKTVRSGLNIHYWDVDTYRRVREGVPAEPGEPAWVRIYRLAVNHCQALDEQLAEEISRLQALLTGISALAVAADSEAQQRFNLIAAMAAAGLGLPALIISLYGADSFLPLNSFDHAWRALVPIGVTVLLVGGIGLRFFAERRGWRQYGVAALLAVGLLGVLLFAGAFAPAAK
jgi:hypothetical protein